MGRALRSAPEASGEALIQQVGARVRALRLSAGQPRRVLSERSGVSHRFLAQLEAGEGNISIARLDQIARALDTDLSNLLPPSEGTEISRRFAEAPPAVQAQVRALLSPPNRAQRVCLIGLRGAGKSTLGAMVSARLNVPFVELTQEIAALAGMPASEVMALYGEDGYRSLEARAVAHVIAAHQRVILAAAGGIVGQPAAFESLLAAFHTVWLRAAPQEHMDRVRAQGDLRPMAGNPGAMDRLRALLSEREAQYARAEATVDTEGRTPEQSATDLLAAVSSVLGG